MFTAQRKNSVRFNALQKELQIKLRAMGHNGGNGSTGASAGLAGMFASATSSSSLFGDEAESIKPSAIAQASLQEPSGPHVLLRKQILREIIDSERNYVEFLEVLWYMYKIALFDECGESVYRQETSSTSTTASAAAATRAKRSTLQRTASSSMPSTRRTQSSRFSLKQRISSLIVGNGGGGVGVGTKSAVLKPLMVFPLNLKQILLLQDSFLNILKSRYGLTPSQRAAGTGASCIENVESISYYLCVGDIFLEKFSVKSGFISLYVEYLSTFEDSLASFRSLIAADSAFAAWHSKMKKSPQTKTQDIPSLLIMPCQRIPRYVLLLSSLLKETPPDHPDHMTLRLAIELMSNHAEHQNKNIIAMKLKRTKVTRADLLRSTIVDVSGALLEGLFYKQGHVNTRWKLRKFYLFQTHLQYHELGSSSSSESPTGKAKGFISLDGDNIRVVPPDAALHGFEYGFVITTPTRNFFVKSDNRTQAERWISEISRVINLNRQKRRLEPLPLDTNTSASGSPDQDIGQMLDLLTVSAESGLDPSLFEVMLNEFVALRVQEQSDASEEMLATHPSRIVLMQSILNGQFSIYEYKLITQASDLSAKELKAASEPERQIPLAKLKHLEKIVDEAQEEEEKDRQLFSLRLVTKDETQLEYYFEDEIALNECFKFFQTLHRQQEQLTEAAAFEASE